MPTATTTHYTPALQAAVDAALLAFPHDAARIHRGAQIVERGGVREPEAGSHVWHVGIYRYYPVNGACPCPDTVMNKAERCKHKWGRALYKKMHQPTAAPLVRTLRFVATWGTISGVCTVYESGAATMQPYDSDEVLAVPLAQWHEVVLGGRVDMMGTA